MLKYHGKYFKNNFHNGIPIFSCVCVHMFNMYFRMWKHVHVNAGVGKCLALTLSHLFFHHSPLSLWYVVSQSSTAFANNASLAISPVPGISFLHLFGAGNTCGLPYTTAMGAGYTDLIFMPMQQMIICWIFPVSQTIIFNNIFQKQI